MSSNVLQFNSELKLSYSSLWLFVEVSSVTMARTILFSTSSSSVYSISLSEVVSTITFPMGPTSDEGSSTSASRTHLGVTSVSGGHSGHSSLPHRIRLEGSFNRDSATLRYCAFLPYDVGDVIVCTQRSQPTADHAFDVLQRMHPT